MDNFGSKGCIFEFGLIFGDQFMDIIAVRKHFPILQFCTFLNHAATSPYSAPVAEAMHQFIDQLVQGELPPGFVDERVALARNLAAQLVRATPGEIVMTSNTSHGLNIVANGLNWQPGDNVVIPETEFPANVYPWRNLARRGVEIRLVPVRDNRILVDDVAARCDAHTRLVAVSFVEFCTGYRNDLAALGEMCRERNIPLCVDGIQGLGALDLDVNTVPLDFLATGAAKWLMGPVGVGFLYLRQPWIEKLDLTMAGWRGVQEPDDYFRYDSPWALDARRFEIGSLNLLGVIGLAASLKMLLEIGLPNIEKCVLDLTWFLIEGLKRRGYQVISPHATPAERSGIVSFYHEHHPTGELFARLKAARVIVSQRGPYIRVSPHFYNTLDDLEHLFSALP